MDDWAPRHDDVPLELGLLLRSVPKEELGVLYDCEKEEHSSLTIMSGVEELVGWVRLAGEGKLPTPPGCGC